MKRRFLATTFCALLFIGCAPGKPLPPPNPGTSPNPGASSSFAVVAAGSAGCTASIIIVSAQVGSCSSSPAPVSKPGQPAAPGQTVATNGEIDWPTFGFDAARSGDNTSEKTLTSATVNGLRELWSYKLGDSIEASPVLAAGVKTGAGAADVVYVGNHLGMFAAVNAQTGAAIWTKQLGATQSACGDTPGSIFGVGGTASIDRTLNRVYVADGKGILWALDLGTGAVSAGWPAGGTQVVTNSAADHVRSALTLSANASTVFVATSAYCDDGNWNGAIRSVDAASGQVTQTFYFATNSGTPPGGGKMGGSIWGYGGLAIDPDTQNLYGATGNIPGNEFATLNSDSIMEWNPSALDAPLGSYEPHGTGGDDDFGGSVALYDDGGQCLAVGRKDGNFFVFDRTNINQGPTVTLALGGRFATPAHSSATHMLYVSPSQGGLDAYMTGPGCTLNPAWQDAGGGSVPVIAGDVLYDGFGGTLKAFNAATGAALWNSGNSIAGQIWGQPIVVNGHAYVGDRNGILYGFGL